MVYDHLVEIAAVAQLSCHPLEDWAIRVEIANWCEENCAQVAMSQDRVVWFARETDAAMFYLRFA